MIFSIWEMRKSRHISQQSRVGVCNTVLFQKSSGFVCLHKEGKTYRLCNTTKAKSQLMIKNLCSVLCEKV